VSTPRDDDTTWLGRASARPPVDPWADANPYPSGAPHRAADTYPTAEQPIVPPYQPPTVIYVETPARRRVGLIIGLMLIAFAAGGVVAVVTSPALRDAIGIGPGPSTTTSPTVTPSHSPTPTTPPPPGVGDPVQDGALEFLVTEVDCGVPSVKWGPVHDDADGQFCVVGLGVKNTSNRPAVLAADNQWAIAADGSRHNAKSTAGVLANHGADVWLKWISPGDTAAGKLVFDIPDDTTLQALELHDSGLSNGVLVTVS
jgi:hypothetical protein